MDVRKTLGGLAEDQLNKLVDELEVDALIDKGLEKVKAELSKYLNDEIKLKLKANYIDKLDGEDDIPDVN